MIEIVFPYWLGAAILGAIMILLIVIAGICLYVKAWDFAAMAIIILLMVDLVTAITSAGFMTTPIHVPCEEGYPDQYWLNATPGNHCVYPSINPYEQQPIHPLMWTLEAFRYISTGFHGAVKVRIDGGIK